MFKRRASARRILQRRRSVSQATAAMVILALPRRRRCPSSTAAASLQRRLRAAAASVRPRPAAARAHQGGQELQRARSSRACRVTSSTSPCSAASRPRPRSSASRSTPRARRSSTRPCRSRSSTRWSPAKPDAMLIAPTDVTAMQAPLQPAAQPASRSSWSTPPSTTRRFAVSAISSDNEGGGKAAFDAIKQLHPNGGKVLVMSVDPGISTDRRPRQGLRGRRQGRPRVQVPRRAVLATTTRPPRPSW